MSSIFELCLLTIIRCVEADMNGQHSHIPHSRRPVTVLTVSKQLTLPVTVVVLSSPGPPGPPHVPPPQPLCGVRVGCQQHRHRLPTHLHKCITDRDVQAVTTQPRLTAQPCQSGHLISSLSPENRNTPGGADNDISRMSCRNVEVKLIVLFNQIVGCIFANCGKVVLFDIVPEANISKPTVVDSGKWSNCVMIVLQYPRVGIGCGSLQFHPIIKLQPAQHTTDSMSTWWAFVVF